MQQTGASGCSACQGVLRASYFQANGHILCESCAGNLRNAFQSESGGFARLAKAAALGAGGGLAGSAVYTAVLAFAHVNAALITILIGWLVGKGVSKGCGGRGYQILAVAITWMAIGFSATLSDVLTSDVGHGSIFAGIVICFLGAFMGAALMAMTGVLGAVITFFGLMRAWQMNRPVQIEVTGPHALGSATQPAAPEVPPLPASIPSLAQSA